MESTGGFCRHPPTGRPPKERGREKAHVAGATAVLLLELGRAELMWVISEQCTCAIITVVSLLLHAALNYRIAIHPHDKWKDMENYT